MDVNQTIWSLKDSSEEARIMKRISLISLGLAFLAGGVFAGCGDAVTDGDYAGEPLFSFGGPIFLRHQQQNHPTPPETTDARLALFWQMDDSTTLQLLDAEEQGAAAFSVFPSEYSARLYHPPPDEALVSIPNSGLRFAMALILLYDDVDLNGQYEPDGEDKLIGGSSSHVLLYAEAELTQDALSSLTKPAPAGFSIARIESDECVEVRGPPPHPNDPPPPQTSELEVVSLTPELQTAKVHLIITVALNEFFPDVYCSGNPPPGGPEP